LRLFLFFCNVDSQTELYETVLPKQKSTFMRKFISKPFGKGMSLCLLLGTLLLSACGGGDDDEAKPKPTASFTYEADGAEVTFTNTSKNATTYEWDFGDGETSTEAAPVHQYEAFGKYTVTLEATGPGGSATSLPDELTLAKTSPVVIDGTFTDWDDIEAAATSVDGDGGSLKTLKVDYDAERIYVYVSGDIHNQIRMYLNSDNDGTTGATSPGFDYLWKELGADYFLETDFATGAQMFADDPNSEDWAWTETIAWANGATFLTASEIKTIGDTKYAEFSFLRASVPGISSAAIRFGLVDINTTTWADAGGLPARTHDGAEGQIFGESYLLDLTK
jgi:PKD repeat protein